MYQLVIHPTKGLCVAEDNKYITLADAMKSIPKVANELMDKGDIQEAVFDGDKCYIGEPTFEFFIDTPISYPDEYEQACVVDFLIPWHVVVVSRKFGCYTCRAYIRELYNKVVDIAAARFPEWKFFLPKPTPEQAVLNEDEIKEDILEEPEAYEPGKTSAMVRALHSVSTEEVPKSELVQQLINADNLLDLSALVPDECKGETWALTYESVTLAAVIDDGYCIENDWEARGMYWIIDCPLRGKRLIHSDALSYNHEFKITECGE